MVAPHSTRRHADLPPSSADKWLRCWGWLRTVAAHREKFGVAPSSAAADEGTRAHERMEAFLQAHPNLANAPTSPKTPKWLEGFGDEDHDEDLLPVLEWIEAQPGKLYSETRVDFGEAHGFVGLGGTVDLVFDEPDRLTIADLKFGRGLVEVKRNPQLMTYLAGARDLFGSRSSYRLVILQPRAWHPDGIIREYTVSHSEFTVFVDEMLTAIEANYNGGECDPGDHCRNYCPALGSCRAVAMVARQRLAVPEDEE